MTSVFFITPNKFEENKLALFKRWWGDDVIIVKITLGETPESKQQAFRDINELVNDDDINVVVYHDFSKDYISGFLDATNVREDIKAVITLTELEEAVHFRFRTT